MEADSEIKFSFNRCKICNGKIRLLKNKTVDGLILAKCENCGIEFVKDIPASIKSAEDSFEYTTNYYAHTSFKRPPKFYYGLNKIIGYLKILGKDQNISHLRLLDVGCGSGEFLLMCQEKGFNVSGIELSKSAAELNNQKGLFDIYVGDVNIIKETFDIVTFFDVLEHIEDPRAFLKNIFRILNSGGIIYIETPRKSLLDIYLAALSCIRLVKNNRISRAHVQLYSDKSLHILLEDSGFEIISFETRQSLSWKDKRQYIINLGIKSENVISFLSVVADIFIRLRIFGHNKAIILAKKKLNRY